MIYRHIAFIYALKASLRNTVDEIYVKYLSDEDLEELKKHSNKHNALLNIQARALQQLLDSDKIDGFKYMQINEMLVRFTDSMGMCERIKNTIFSDYLQLFNKSFYLAVCRHIYLSNKPRHVVLEHFLWVG